ncbi:exodeoxyribonuclease VII large subunit [Lacticaseibacillus pabuli]|uniref:Exodeoxyribonuclease 7 large subunit n=1 Tax=Lacticaseibacillus pabuli TaxID=3025672 RepID=A0ABY7WU36_9LACO|nr:exodeoxyribonuclease VII large subunit [Lacticaseibacillus sp. KACC 23028]WDF83668.1 exodeoxyribonuclease VII large subunit [Lacticaseibacillus sp. KACC 23028]
MDRSQYLSVSALTTYIGRKFTQDPYMQRVYVVGEVSNFRQRPGHQYFSLKDDSAKIGVAMFKSAFAKVKFKLEEGMKVLAVGRIGVYAPSGNYQMTIERLEPDGVGALYAAFQQLNEQLSKEGLYQVHHEWPLTRFPKRVAVVTSPSGAVIHDIMTTVARRYPSLEIVLFPAQVQGDAASGDIVRQLQRVNEMPGFDSVIVGRGGGSIEDLWPFNTEEVARQIAAMKIPVVSSVGHETDTTIADYVADYRAATPTAAAEYVTPLTAADVQRGVQQLEARMVRAQAARLQNLRARLTKSQNSVMLTQPDRIYDGYLQRVDQLRLRLAAGLPRRIEQLASREQLLRNRLARTGLQQRLQSNDDRLSQDGRRLVNAQNQFLQQQRQRVQRATAALDHLSPLKTMGRGYAYVTADDGAILQKNADYQVGATVNIHTVDGQVNAKVTGKEEQHG